MIGGKSGLRSADLKHIILNVSFALRNGRA